MPIAPVSPTSRFNSPGGFSLVELLVVVTVMALVGASAVPMTASGLAAYRIRNDAEAVKNLVSLAKMRAASRFTRARVYVDRAANTYRLEVFNRDTNAWDIEGATIAMSAGVNFGFGGLADPPPNTQNVIGQSPQCTDAGGAAIANTSCIVFNSRGVPIVMPAATPIGNNALYITNGSVVYATTVTTTPLVRFWWTGAGAANWVQQ